ncbi:Tn3 family transposase [Streptosporangium canum]
MRSMPPPSWTWSRPGGDGSTVAADGTQVDTYIDSLLAETSIRYGGFGGIAYHYISELSWPPDHRGVGAVVERADGHLRGAGSGVPVACGHDRDPDADARRCRRDAAGGQSAVRRRCAGAPELPPFFRRLWIMVRGSWERSRLWGSESTRWSYASAR